MYNLEEIVLFLLQSGVSFKKIGSDSVCDKLDDDFLKRYGFPQLNDVFIIEDLAFCDPKKVEIIKEHYCIIGTDGIGDICIDINTHELVSINNLSEQCYINQNLSDFVYCLYLYKKLFIDVSEGLDDYEENQIFYNLKKLFDDIDVRILSSENTWWNEIIEQLQYGLI